MAQERAAGPMGCRAVAGDLDQRQQVAPRIEQDVVRLSHPEVYAGLLFEHPSMIVAVELDQQADALGWAVVAGRGVY
jgi:hypothetical protein